MRIDWWNGYSSQDGERESFRNNVCCGIPLQVCIRKLGYWIELPRYGFNDACQVFVIDEGPPDAYKKGLALKGFEGDFVGPWNRRSAVRKKASEFVIFQLDLFFRNEWIVVSSSLVIEATSWRKRMVHYIRLFCVFGLSWSRLGTVEPRSRQIQYTRIGLNELKLRWLLEHSVEVILWSRGVRCAIEISQGLLGSATTSWTSWSWLF